MAYFFGKGLTGNILDAYNQSVGGVPATTKTPTVTPTGGTSPIGQATTEPEGLTGGDLNACLKKCQAEYDQYLLDHPYEIARFMNAQILKAACDQKCYAGGGGDGDGDGTEETICKGGRGPVIDLNGNAKCDEGWTMKTYKREDGSTYQWCCPPETPTPPGPEACTGGYKLADSPLIMGGGSVWSDDWLPASAGWYRDPQAEAGWVWHPDWGYQWVADVYKYVAGQKTLTANKAKAVCRKGFKSTVIKNEDWCCPEGGDGDGEDNYWGWPEEMVDFYKLLVGRGKDLLGRPLGWSPEEQAGYFGQNFENVRGAEAGTRQNLMDILSRQGMLGTGQELSTMGNLAWNTENQISDLQRQLFLENEAQKRQDLTNYTTLANMLFGSGMNYNTLIESINAARRGEGNTFMNWLMNWFLANKNA